jgi:long-subunit fatty acid transport protein
LCFVKNSFLVGIAAFISAVVSAEQFSIPTPGGPVSVQVSHVGPGGGVVSAPTPSMPDFRPPTMFSAPLRSGSGGRALSLGGAFTAVADDATAASWNPAGLIQLEDPEASFVLRASRASLRNSSSDQDYLVEDSSYGNFALNYLSYVYPVRMFERNFVFSLNYQEDYDFTQKFSARSRNRSSRSSLSSKSEIFNETKTEHYEEGSTEIPGGINMIDVTSHLRTLQKTQGRELISSGLMTDLDFEQQGVIDAITLAGAAEIIPALSFGAAFNLHGDNTLGGNAIRSRTTARYSGSSTSEAWLNTIRSTSGTYEYNGVIHIPPGGSFPFPINLPISDSGKYDPFEESTDQYSIRRLSVDGKYVEDNEFRNLWGYNGTLGLLWTTCRFLTLGATVDLPWTAHAKQKKTIRQTVTTTVTDAAGNTSTSTSKTVTHESKDVEFDFPLYWATGALMRWTDRFYTTTDISQTQWSGYSYTASGQSSVNPLDGNPSGQSKLDDCWAIRQGAEYLLPMKIVDIAFRGGLFWEQRPATGSPDQYYGYSLGFGLSFLEERQLILDFAWMHTIGNDVMGSLVPGQRGLTTDVAYDEFYVSAIWRF